MVQTNVVNATGATVHIFRTVGTSSRLDTQAAAFVTHHGLKVQAVEDWLQVANLPKQGFYGGLRLSPSTLSRKSKDDTLDAAVTERLVRQSELMVKAAEVFGDGAGTWMKGAPSAGRPNAAGCGIERIWRRQGTADPQCDRTRGRGLTPTVYRIGTHKARTLQDLGYGSTLESGRWHLTAPDGLPVVYAGGSRAICQLEKRVHCNGVTPINLIMLALQMPAGAPLRTLADLGTVLPPDWIDQPTVTQDVGVAWRKSGSGLGLWVPSAVEPDEPDLIINPSHSAYGAVVLTVVRDPFAFDRRMFD